MTKIIATVVFLAFMIMTSFAVAGLGGSWPVQILIVAMSGALMWEVWVQPVRDEAYRQEILSNIENFKKDFEVHRRPGNLAKAQNVIEELETQLDVVSNAYIELKREEPDGESPQPSEV